LRHRTRLEQVLRLGCLAIVLCQPALFAAHAGAITETLMSPAGVASNPAPSESHQTDPLQSRAVLKLLDPAAIAEPEDGLFSGFQRWADILVGDYETFLPMIAIFITIGATALIVDIRRRRLTGTRYQAGLRDPVRLRGLRNVGQPRAMTPSNVSAAPALPTVRTEAELRAAHR
jgi:hypothetical protein